MKPITIAEAFITITPRPVAQRWPGIDTEYLVLHLTLGRRGLRLTVSVLGGTEAWSATGWRAIVQFERLAGMRAMRDPRAYLPLVGLQAA